MATWQWWAMAHTADGDWLIFAWSAAEMAALLARLRQALPLGDADLRRTAAPMAIRSGR